MFSEFSRQLLPIYLNDHLAAATGGRELVRRAAGSNRGTEYGDFLAGLAAEIDADRDLLVNVMSRLGIRRDELKVTAGWVAEKFGRLKLNGRLTSYSPLSRVVELEALGAGVHAKRGLWRTLAAVAQDDSRLAEFDFVDLIERAAEQLVGIETEYDRAVDVMLASDNRRPSPAGS
jgi:hypothetical protein